MQGNIDKWPVGSVVGDLTVKLQIKAPISTQDKKLTTKDKS